MIKDKNNAKEDTDINKDLEDFTETVDYIKYKHNVNYSDALYLAFNILYAKDLKRQNKNKTKENISHEKSI